MSKKMTYVEAIDVALAAVADEAAVERLTALRESLVKRAASKHTTASKKQIETAETAERLFAAMEQGVVYSGSEIQDLLPELGKASPQKIAALVKVLGDRVVTSKVKGKAAYSLA